jgi:PPOX class probable F420-dependent enzyme
MAEMTRGEWRAFLSEGTRTGKVATTRKDGSPHLTPVWFVLDGDDIVFTTSATSVKGRTIQRDSRVAMCVDDQTPPYSFVVVSGTCTTSTDLDELRDVATRVGARYMGEDRAAEFGARNAVPGELLVRLAPTKVIAEAAVAD